ncbi:RraA family protein [Mycetocola spongiae]|uniref:RraA family protein n=1 Tax=Mycetocola spongiae TaxID=2859226 RepID=UPI001CF3DA5F|nr:hypothetical protein [Mycetocola spongiae]UCR88659.1 hypothetical protein KXZ72_11935 [Mycetocola spongiae]
MTIENSAPHIIELTSSWTGERGADGRPRVADDILQKLAFVSTEHAWHVLDAAGYPYQFCGGWQATRPGSTLVGRAVTSHYLPHRPDLREATERAGERLGYPAGTQPNAWVVDILTPGDVMVADIFGKVSEGTVIGDNLGTAIASRTGAGAVIDGGVRDLRGLRGLDNANFFYRAADPTPIRDVVLASVNGPVSIGGVSVLPGDIVLGTETGVTFIPAHLAAEVVAAAEEIGNRDRFSQSRIAAGIYTSAAVDIPVWPAPVEEDYRSWLTTNFRPLGA